jgi:ankyrin repeat protein
MSIDELRAAIETANAGDVQKLLFDDGVLDTNPARAAAPSPVRRSAAVPLSLLACTALQHALAGGSGRAGHVEEAAAVVKLLARYSEITREVQPVTGRTMLHAVIFATAPLANSSSGVDRDAVAASTVRCVLESTVKHLAAQRRKARVERHVGTAAVASTEPLSPASAQRGAAHGASLLDVHAGLDAIPVGALDPTSSATSPAKTDGWVEIFDDEAAATLCLLRQPADVEALTPIAACLRSGNVVALDCILAFAMPLIGMALREQKIPNFVSAETVLATPPPSSSGGAPALPLTALHLAASHGQAGVARYLLRRGATASPTGSGDRTRGGWITIDVHASDPQRVEGGTALHVAAGAGWVDVVRVLLDESENGCDPMTRDKLGRTALHVAAEGPLRRGSGVSLASNAPPPDNVDVMAVLLQWHEDHLPSSPLNAVPATASGKGDVSHSFISRDKRRLHAKHLLAAVDRGGRSALDAALRAGKTANVKFLMRVASTLETDAVSSATSTVANTFVAARDDELNASTGLSSLSRSRHTIDASIDPRSSSVSTCLSVEQSSKLVAEAKPVTERERAAAELSKALAASTSASEMWRSHRKHVMTK